MQELLQNIWGYMSGILVWVCDHSSVLMAGTLFVLQVIYQIYRIKKARKECNTDE